MVNSSNSIFETGIRPVIDAYLLEKSKEIRAYGDYWSASSAGYCMRKLIFERLGVPPVVERDPRLTRVFESGNIFHAWLQGITKKAGISIAQEQELLDGDLMVRGHFDDLIEIGSKKILYDYKTQNSKAFSYQKDRAISYYHKMQLATYMYMLRWNYPELEEARILRISKDDLRMSEDVLLWSGDLETEIMNYWSELNKWWNEKKMPPCTCADHEGGFMATEKFNPYFKYGEPCSLRYYQDWKKTQDGKN